MNPSSINILAACVLALFGVAIYGLLVTRNLIKIMIVLQILVKAAVLGLVVAGKMNGQINLSQSIAVTVIVADTVVVIVGLALAIQARQVIGTLDADALSKFRED
jgi:NADH:ubiquinone oxidoreductase subunit K